MMTRGRPITCARILQICVHPQFFLAKLGGQDLRPELKTRLGTSSILQLYQFVKFWPHDKFSNRCISTILEMYLVLELLVIFWHVLFAPMFAICVINISLIS